jgi:hypothetical protein
VKCKIDLIDEPFGCDQPKKITYLKEAYAENRNGKTIWPMAIVAKFLHHH